MALVMLAASPAMRPVQRHGVESVRSECYSGGLSSTVQALSSLLGSNHRPAVRHGRGERLLVQRIHLAGRPPVIVIQISYRTAPPLQEKPC